MCATCAPTRSRCLKAKPITETSQKALNDEAFVLVNGIAGAVLEAGKIMARAAEAAKAEPKEKGKGATKEGAGDERQQF